jgi:predicted permease
MLSLVLAEKIFSLFLIMGMGFALVRSGLMKSKDSWGLSIASLYVISPCMIITAFQVDLTEEVQQGFLLAMAAALAVELLYMFLGWAFGKVLHLDAVEKASAVYSNCGNLVIPLVLMMFGQDMVIYCTAYMVFQTFFLWSHGKSLIMGSKKIDWRRILLGVNMIGVYVGLLLFITGWRLPGPIYSAVSSVGEMIGPAAMLITGMLMGGMDFKEFRSYKRLPIPVLLRLVVFPLVALVFLKFSGIASLASNGEMVLLITLLAAAAPSASNINQMAQIYDRDAGYASSINVMTILCCIVTMPIMVALYQL